MATPAAAGTGYAKVYNGGCEPERSQARLEADEEGREGRIGICKSACSTIGCARRTPLEATVRSGRLCAQSSLLRPGDPRHKESGMAAIRK